MPVVPIFQEKICHYFDKMFYGRRRGREWREDGRKIHNVCICYDNCIAGLKHIMKDVLLREGITVFKL